MIDLEKLKARASECQNVTDGLWLSKAADEIEYMRSVFAKTHEVAPAVDAQPVAWESTTPVYRRFITDERYQKLSPEARKWYKPYLCPHCASAQSEGLRKDAIRREALEQASALCQAIANGYVSDVNPKRSREAADAAIFCAREIAALSQHTGEKDD